MALYQRQNELSYSSSSVFNTTNEPGASAPFGGIYKCTGCGLEIGIAKFHALPPQNHHQHPSRYTPIRWQPVAHAPLLLGILSGERHLSIRGSGRQNRINRIQQCVPERDNGTFVTTPCPERMIPCLQT
jgi:hypothetical protein